MFGKRATIGDDPAFDAATLIADPTPPRQREAATDESTARIASHSATHSEGYFKLKAQITARWFRW